MKMKKSKENFSTKCCNVAYVSIYISIKYFFNESTPKIYEVFPNITLTKKEIINLEKEVIIDYLNYHIYRSNVYDMLQIDINPIKLFSILNKNIVFGHNVFKIVKALTNIHKDQS